MHKFKADLERTIVKDFLRPENATFYYVEGIRFNSHYLKDEALKNLVSNFSTISQSEEARKYLKQLPFQQFYSIVNNSELNVKEEIEVVRMIDDYLTYRKTLP
jgi:hypothetical protein